MNDAWGKVAGIARIGMADVVRQKSFIVLLLLCLFFVFLVRGCWGASMVIDGRVVSGGTFAVQIVQAVFVIVTVAAMLVAGLLSMRAFRRDRDEGMLAFILSKPVPRIHYLVGKIAGLWLLTTSFMLILHGAILAIHMQHSGSVGAGCVVASAMSALNVLFVILAVSLLSLALPEIFAFLAVFGIVAGAFIFDAIARAARSDAVQSILAHSSAQEGLTWWKVVYWIWPKSGALQTGAASFIDPLSQMASIDVLVPLASVGVYCLVFAVLLFLRFEREEIA